MAMNRFTIHERTVELLQGDITQQDTDAIVNAANAALAGGGGVDGAIHRAAGPSIMEETRRKYPQGCPTGSAVITGAGNLKARHIIHAVGPVWQGGARGEDELLADAYTACLRLADEHGLQSIAFPSLSTGAYAFPIDRAAAIALRAIVDHLRGPTSLKLVRMVLWGDKAMNAFQRELEMVAETSTQTT